MLKNSWLRTIGVKIQAPLQYRTSLNSWPGECPDGKLPRIGKHRPGSLHLQLCGVGEKTEGRRAEFFPKIYLSPEAQTEPLVDPLYQFESHAITCLN